MEKARAAERGAPALREHENLNRAELELELELCAPPAVTEKV